MRVQPHELPVGIMMNVIIACTDKFTVQGGKEPWLGSNSPIHHGDNI